jgi:NSS family neurotransmitter:Na+ symporter
MSKAEAQNTWKSEAGFIWSMIGSAVGFANVLSFSALCYKNGGGAFLIPYLIAHLLVGLPFLFLEATVGQKTKLPIVSAMGNILGTRGRMLGWLAVLCCATIGGFYIVLTGYSVAYTFFAATGYLSLDSAHFFKEAFLKTSPSLSVWGGVAFGVLVATLFVIAFTWITMARNIQSGVEKLCSFFLPLLGLLVTLFSLIAFFLPGALIGIKNYLIPDFHRLCDWALWREVFGQVFFSLSLGLGIVTGYSRHNPSNFNIRRSMIMVALGDFIISFVAGIAIFGCIGFMSHHLKMPFDAILQTDSAFEIGFVIFPMILSQLGEVVARVLGPMFFFCIFIAGVTGVFSIVESIAGSFEVEFNLTRRQAISGSLVLISALSLPFCMGNGQHVISALAPMVLGNVFLIGGIAEIVLFLFLSSVLSKDPLWFNGQKRSFAFHSLRLFVLPLLTCILLGGLYAEFTSGWGLEKMVRWIWFALVLAIGFVFAKRRPVLASKKIASM